MGGVMGKSIDNQRRENIKCFTKNLKEEIRSVDEEIAVLEGSILN
jgi:hypothetical protein